MSKNPLFVVTPEEADEINAGSDWSFEIGYKELIYAVGMKHPNETRHETALRYIKQAEDRKLGAAKETQLPCAWDFYTNTDSAVWSSQPA